MSEVYGSGNRATHGTLRGFVSKVGHSKAHRLKIPFRSAWIQEIIKIFQCRFIFWENFSIVTLINGTRDETIWRRSLGSVQIIGNRFQKPYSLTKFKTKTHFKSLSSVSNKSYRTLLSRILHLLRFYYSEISIAIKPLRNGGFFSCR